MERRGMIRETVFGVKAARNAFSARRIVPDDNWNVERSVSESTACSILIAGLRWWNVERESWWILGKLEETDRRGCGE